MKRERILEELGTDEIIRLTPKELDQFVLAMESCFSTHLEVSRPNRCILLIDLVNLMLGLGISTDVLGVKGRIETFLAHNFKYADRYRFARAAEKEKMRAPDIDLGKLQELMILAGFSSNYFRSSRHRISSYTCQGSADAVKALGRLVDSVTDEPHS